MDSATATHVGYVRSRNEDACLDAPERRLWVVCDGLGGHAAGHVASRIAIETIGAQADLDGLEKDPAATLERALRAAHAEINAEMERDPATTGMGTTAVIAYIDETARQATLGSVGDSRIYCARDGGLAQLTPDDVYNSPFGRSLTQALGGHDEIHPHIRDVDVGPGDRLLLCSDGLTDMVSDDLLARLLGEDGSARDLADRLVETALDRGGHDNVTVAVVVVDGG